MKRRRRTGCLTMAVLMAVLVVALIAGVKALVLRNSGKMIPAEDRSAGAAQGTADVQRAVDADVANAQGAANAGAQNAMDANWAQGAANVDVTNAQDTANAGARGATDAPAQAHPEILLVNGSHPIPEDYRPAELVNLYEQKRHFQLAASDICLERAAFEAANRMFEAAEAAGVNGFILTSGYRSAEKQAEVYAAQQDGTAARAGFSEHQTGLAFDVTARRDGGGFEDTPQYAWLIEHCWDYGFILRYPQGKEDVTGTPCEPWHYRYVGEQAAQEIRAQGCALEEYCGG